MSMPDHIDQLADDVRGCQICVKAPLRSPLPHLPRPVLRVSATAQICIAGQAPGTRVHASGIPFDDPSGDRLRAWMGVDHKTFYDVSRIAIVPMGFCFPGLDTKGGDLPPRRECRLAWHARIFAAMPQIKLLLAVGAYAQAYHMRALRRANLTATVAAYRDIVETTAGPVMWPLPHPSWRNNAWIKKHPWFEAELLPSLRQSITALL